MMGDTILPFYNPKFPEEQHGGDMYLAVHSQRSSHFDDIPAVEFIIGCFLPMIFCEVGVQPR